ncbi:hypothetical protein [Kitasatospora herbaricolor]|uniref:hypothetical protein n=1 Tax=Kitasatospora herbaricolor TaxID=68217 RepID=UPI0036DE8474
MTREFAKDSTGVPVGTVALFLNLGSALVALLHNTGGAHTDFDWLCLGCGAHSFSPTHRPTARNSANDHAATCRALPWPPHQH